MLLEYVKETSRLCRQVFHQWKISIIIRETPRLETAPNPWPVNSEESLGLYRIDMQMVQLQVCDQVFMVKKSYGYIPDTFPFSSHNDPSCQGPMWESGSCEDVKDSCGLAQNPILEWKSECQPFTTVKVTADPCVGG